MMADGRVALKLEESPFYAEGGGQVADRGWVHTESGKLEVDEVVRFEDDQVDRRSRDRRRGRRGRACQGDGQRRPASPDSL